MKILIVAASGNELLGLKKQVIDSKINFKNLEIKFLETGIGVVATTYQLTRYLQIQKSKPNLIINIGIAGTFKREFPLGKVFNITQDRFADLGAEDGNEFLDLIDLGLLKQNDYPFQNGVICNLTNLKSEYLKTLPTAHSITVSTASGKTSTIKKLIERYNPDTESMEGCACFYVARMEQIPILQIRAISNYIEKRNRKNWKVELALQNLNHAIVNFLNELNSNCEN